MISSAPTKIAFPHREDGGARDPDPARRAQRRQTAGVEIERRGRWDYEVRAQGRQLGRRRTFAGAEQLAAAVSAAAA
jgi:hypothetical protein